MFKFLKEKLKKGIENISKKIDEEGVSEEKLVEKRAEPEKKGFFSKLKEKFSKKEELPEEEAKEEKIGVRDEAEEYKKKEESVEEKKVLEKKEEQIKEKKYEPEPQKKAPIQETVKIHDEVEEYQKRREIEKEKKKIEIEEKTIQDKINKKEMPSLYELEILRAEKEKVKKIEHDIEEPKEEIKIEKEEEIKEKKGFFQSIKEKITTKKIDKEHFEKIFWELEMVLLENNVAVEVIEKIKDDLSQEIVDKPLPRGKIEDTITHTLKTSIEQLLNVDSFSLLEKIKQKKPFVICFVGINGSGKTTTIAKTANLLLKNNLSVVIAAADTFRAASIEQLQLHADKLGVKLIKHNYGSDPAAVAFDAVKHAQSKNIDVVLIDTAGRQHSNANLVDEMKKIIRVAKPDLKIFVGESITGNDCVEQAKKFNEAIGIDAIILSKADIDEKGGAAISVSYVTQKPIVYIGTGQNYEDLKEFEPSVVMAGLGLE